MRTARTTTARSAGVFALVIGVLCLFAVSGCADNDLAVAYDGPELTDLTGQSTVEIVVTDNVFTPRHIKVSPGTEIVWVNKGRNSHNVLPASGDAFEKTDLPVGGTVAITFSKLGTVKYYCSIHGTPRRGQTGTIVVV